MLETLWTWRGEAAGIAALAGTWLAFRHLHWPGFWRMWTAGLLLGAAVEFMTEPEWRYDLQVYVWRDVSPFVMAGWGVMFAWVVALSDGLYRRWFGDRPGAGGLDPRRKLTDLLVGVPLLLGNELLGLHVLQVWRYAGILEWNTMLPVIGYPWEGVVALVFFLLAMPAAVRYARGNPVS